MLENTDQESNLDDSTSNSKEIKVEDTNINTDVSEEVVKETVVEENKEELVKEETVETIKGENLVEKAEEKPIIDFTKLTLEELADSLKNLIHSEPIQKIKSDVDAIKNNFNTKFKELIDNKKAEFLTEGGNEIDFHFTAPIKNVFFGFFNDYRSKIKQYHNDK